MFKITVVYGPDLEVMESDTPITIGAVKRNQDLRDQLGYGDNVNLLINGVTMPDEATIPNGSTVTIETAANKKAEAEPAIA